MEAAMNIQATESGLRLDVFLAEKLEHTSRSAAQKLSLIHI